jgi:putative transposase
MCINPDLTLAKQMQLIKGESSYWINRQGLIPVKFEWGDEYFAESIGYEDVDRIRNYIRCQEMHHRKISFEDEYNSFLINAGFIGG